VRLLGSLPDGRWECDLLRVENATEDRA